MQQCELVIRLLLVCGLIGMWGCAEGEEDRLLRDVVRSNEVQQSRELSPDAPSLAPHQETVTHEPNFEVEEPSFEKPVMAAMRVVRGSVGGESVVDVWVKLLIAGGHHVYGNLEEPGPFQPLAVSLRLPEGDKAVGSWTYPKPVELDAHAVYTDSVVLHLRLRQSVEAGSPIEATVQYQVCNEDVCYPPDKLLLSRSLD